MAKPETQNSETLTVTCPTCHERLVVQLSAQLQSVACTFCSAAVLVPALESVRRQQAENKPHAPPVDEYALAVDEAPGPRPAKKVKVAQGSGKSKGEAPVVSLECPTCHERVKTTAGEKWGKVPCTFCGVTISVPDRQTVLGWQAKKVAPRKREEIGEYTAGPAIERAPLPTASVFDKLAEIRQEVAPPPPRWTFFSRVFTLPWHKDVIVRWAFMSFGFTAMLGVGLVVVHLARTVSGFGGIAIAFFMLPIIWISFMTVSYSSACFMSVLESTTGGLDEIEAWPEPNWREWMPQMFYLGWIAGAPSAISYGIAVLLEMAGLRPGLSLAAFFLLYPISLLSALEANTVWVPLTWPIVSSLARWWWCWLTFYVLAGLTLGTVVVAGAAIVVSGQALLALALGPITAAGILIYARLLGRLGWRMTSGEQPRTKRKAV